VRFDRTAHGTAPGGHEAADALHAAVEHEEFAVVYQPVVALGDGGIVAVEALVRWQRPDRGLLAPAEFLPLAEEIGLMAPIGRSMLREACGQVAGWRHRLPGHAGLSVTVNLSARQLHDEELVDGVRAILADTGLAPDALVLEISETVAMQHPRATMRRLAALRELGVGLAIDDLGSGYSSLSSLCDLPVNILKIARPFVERAAEGAAGAAVARLIVSLAASLDVDVVAEGVETVEQADALRQLGCRLGQGFLFHRPVPAVELEQLLEARPASAARAAA